MAVEDYFDFSELDTEGEIECKYCGADELHWEQARGPHREKRWVLMEENGAIHCCPNCPSLAPARAEEFTD